MTDTKTRILDTAERLFADHGYAATSLRHIINAAGVNLAAVHYHFGSKEELLTAAVLRKAAPVNAERLRNLDEVEARAGGGRPAVDDVLRAFLEPTFRVARESPEMVRLMGRLYGEADVLPSILERNFGPVIARFRSALRRSVPDLPPEELAWRIHFAMGAMAHVLRMPPLGVLPEVPRDPEADCARLVAFLAAGFKAAVPAIAVEEKKA